MYTVRPYGSTHDMLFSNFQGEPTFLLCESYSVDFGVSENIQLHVGTKIIQIRQYQRLTFDLECIDLSTFRVTAAERKIRDMTNYTFLDSVQQNELFCMRFVLIGAF